MMTYREKIRNIKKSKLVSLTFFIFILVYGLSFSVLFSFAMNSVFNIIKSVKVPDGYYISNLDPSDPRFETSFSIRNEGFTEITDLSINISESILYFENNSSEVCKIKIFQKQIIIGNVMQGAAFTRIIHINYSDFNIGLLSTFESTANFSLGYQEILDIDIQGRYFNKLIPFKISINSLCLTCGSYI
jgi:hypothetical protein